MKKTLTAFLLALLITASAATAFANGIMLDAAKDQKSGQTEYNCCTVDDNHHQ